MAAAERRKWPLRREAAEILIDAARWMIEAKRGGERYYSDKLDERVYRRLLAAATECPGITATIVRELAERVVTNGKPSEDDSGPDGADCAAISSSDEGHSITTEWFGPVGDPWPDGPLRRVDDAFREACLGSAVAMTPLIDACPELQAKSFWLCSFVSPCRRIASDIGHRLGWMIWRSNRCRLVSGDLFPRPIPAVSSRQPGDAIETIVRLVNFATERWAESRDPDSSSEAPSIVIRPIGQEFRWVGNLDVFFWYRERLIDPHAIPTALMALEKWLYDVAEAEKNLLTSGSFKFCDHRAA